MRTLKKKNTLPIKAKDVIVQKPKRTKRSPEKEKKTGKSLEDPKDNPIQPWTSGNLKDLKEKELE